jgi:dolichol kinase
MLRPSFLVLLPIMMVFWVGRILFIKTELKKGIAGLVSSFVCILLIVGYSHLNYVNSGCNNISVVSSINQLDIIMDYNIYSDNKDQEISNLIKEHLGIYALQANRVPDNDVFYDKMWDTDEIISNEYPQERIDKFVKSCITQHSGIYIKKTLSKAVNLSKLTTTSYSAEMKPILFSTLKSPLLELFSVSFAFIYFLLIFDFFYIVLQWMKSKMVPWFKIIVWTAITGQLATAIIGAENEHQRLLLLTMPFIIILFFSYVDMIYYSVDIAKLKKYFVSGSNKKNGKIKGSK